MDRHRAWGGLPLRRPLTRHSPTGCVLSIPLSYGTNPSRTGRTQQAVPGDRDLSLRVLAMAVGATEPRPFLPGRLDPRQPRAVDPPRRPGPVVRCRPLRRPGRAAPGLGVRTSKDPCRVWRGGERPLTVDRVVRGAAGARTLDVCQPPVTGRLACFRREADVSLSARIPLPRETIPRGGLPCGGSGVDG